MVYLTLHVVTCVIKQVERQIIKLTRFHEYVLYLIHQVDGLCTALVFCLSYAIVCMPNTSNSLSVAQLQYTKLELASVACVVLLLLRMPLQNTKAAQVCSTPQGQQ